MGRWKSRKWKWKSLAQEQSGDWRVSSLVPRPTKPYFVPTLQITKKRPGSEAGELLCDFHGHGSSACRERGYQLGRVAKTSTRLSHVMNYASPSSSMAKGHMHSNSLISKDLIVIKMYVYPTCISYIISSWSNILSSWSNIL